MNRFKNILVFVGSERNESAICRAITLAIENRARLTLMDVVRPVPRAIGMLSTNVAEPDDLERLVVSERRDQLMEIAGEYSDTGVAMEVHVAVGDPAYEIVRHVVRDRVDLVLKTADGMSAIGRLFGGVCKSLLRNCPCPVWVLKPEIHGAFDQVLAAIDVAAEDPEHRELNCEILDVAHQVCRRERATLHVVSAWDLWMESALRRRAGDVEIDRLMESHFERIEQRLKGLLNNPRWQHETVEIHVHRGPAAMVIHQVAENIEADLVVMGTVCRTGVPGFVVGNTAETLLSELTCSVLALKPHGFVSPMILTGPAAADYGNTASLA